MTGFYKNVVSFVKEKSLTFLYRAPVFFLKELNMMAISNSYKNIFDISNQDTNKLAKFTLGYAYAYQLLGDILFTSGDYSLSKENIQEFDEIIYVSAYSIIYNELTIKEKQILLASLEDNSNEYIINNLNISKSQLSNYKSVLNKKVIIESNSKSIVFKLPRFKECLAFIKDMEELEI